MRLVSCGSGSAEVVVDWRAEVVVNSAEAVDSAEVVAVVDSVLSVEAEDRVAEAVAVSLAEAVVDSVVVRTVVLSVVDRAEEVVPVVKSVAEVVLLSVEAVDVVSEEAVVVPLREEEDKGGKHGEANTPRAKANNGSAYISDLMVKKPTHKKIASREKERVTVKTYRSEEKEA